jgi:hypothetical protein
MWPTPHRTQQRENEKMETFELAVKEAQMWPTPRAAIGMRMDNEAVAGNANHLNDQVAHPNLMWPTPVQTNQGRINVSRGLQGN